MKKTIKDIAEMTGVSISTVSKVINDYPDVGEKTRAKILAAMNEMGYRSNQVNKVKTKTQMLAVIYGFKVDLNHPFFSEVINSFSKHIGTFGYDLLFFSNNEPNQGDVDDYLERCKRAQIDGCIILGGDPNQSSLYDLDHSEIPCIGVDIKLTGPKSGYLMTDNINLGKKVVEHFYLKGHRKIAHIGGLQTTIVGSERTTGFLQAMTEFGLQLQEGWVKHGDFTEQSGYEAMKSILNSENEQPTALFSASDIMAFGAMAAIKEHGLQVPEDIAIVGCDDIELNKYMAKPLSTMKQDKQKIGQLAAYMIIDLMNNVMGSSAVVVNSELIVRQSG
ncbi:LacI family DNA-binding transcriptional regulator [Radiobacillus sp. PE A8.2]|uniref:LacI family DNA-binding transcriptional regulator n=1 Tax=Radiobacillus sp. PE A8.2 TaxID=3380349 RepID=UPI00388EE9B7